MESKPYTKEFFDKSRALAESSAAEILPIVFSVYEPRSIVDFGCGLGTWLSVAERLGVKTLRGFDGSWIEPEHVHPSVGFSHVVFDERFDPSGPYDLAICLEVAEHVSEAEGQVIVKALCRASDVVLFSAAIPGQGGAEHINERPQSYWVAQFASQGFECFDIIRSRVWDNPGVAFWYAQNILLLVRKGAAVSANLSAMAQPVYDVVHPRLLDAKTQQIRHLRSVNMMPR